MNSVGSYTTAMVETVRSQAKVVEQCSVELYNISRYYYIPKRRLYRIARNLLMIGIIVALVAFVLRQKF